MELCQYCDIEMVMHVSLMVTMPSSWESQLTKRKLAKKEFRVNGASWDNASFTCPKCGWYHSRLILPQEFK